MTTFSNTISPLTIDGSRGEGGGQILRTALGLSATTGRAFVIENIRAGRERPGLMRQHLTAVNAAAIVCGATVVGATIGSTRVAFTPGPVTAGDYHFAVGSAGSSTLVFQTVLPALLTAGGPSTVVLEGGTHNPFAPPLDFLQHAFVPLVNRTGPRLSITPDRCGFYPAGGGRWTATVTPAERPVPLTLDDRGALVRRQATAIVAGLPGEIAVRELATVGRVLGWGDDERKIRQLPADQGPGNVLVLTVENEHATEVVTGFGRRGLAADALAQVASAEMRAYLDSTAPVGDHLADQLLIPMALSAGGQFVATRATPHLTTNAEVVARFLDVDVRIVPHPAGGVCCTIVRKGTL